MSSGYSYSASDLTEAIRNNNLNHVMTIVQSLIKENYFTAHLNSEIDPTTPTKPEKQNQYILYEQLWEWLDLAILQQDGRIFNYLYNLPELPTQYYTDRRVIQMAVRAGKLELLNHFMKKADGKYANIILREACLKGDRQLIELAIFNGACDWTSAMKNAIKSGNGEIIKLIDDLQIEGWSSKFILDMSMKLFRSNPDLATESLTIATSGLVNRAVTILNSISLHRNFLLNPQNRDIKTFEEYQIRFTRLAFVQSLREIFAKVENPLYGDSNLRMKGPTYEMRVRNALNSGTPVPLEDKVLPTVFTEIGLILEKHDWIRMGMDEVHKYNEFTYVSRNLKLNTADYIYPTKLFSYAFIKNGRYAMMKRIYEKYFEEFEYPEMRIFRIRDSGPKPFQLSVAGVIPNNLEGAGLKCRSLWLADTISKRIFYGHLEDNEDSSNEENFPNEIFFRKDGPLSPLIEIDHPVMFREFFLMSQNPLSNPNFQVDRVGKLVIPRFPDPSKFELEQLLQHFVGWIPQNSESIYQVLQELIPHFNDYFYVKNGLTTNKIIPTLYYNEPTALMEYNLHLYGCSFILQYYVYFQQGRIAEQAARERITNFPKKWFVPVGLLDDQVEKFTVIPNELKTDLIKMSHIGERKFLASIYVERKDSNGYPVRISNPYLIQNFIVPRYGETDPGNIGEFKRIFLEWLDNPLIKLFFQYVEQTKIFTNEQLTLTSQALAKQPLPGDTVFNRIKKDPYLLKIAPTYYLPLSKENAKKILMDTAREFQEKVSEYEGRLGNMDLGLFREIRDLRDQYNQSYSSNDFTSLFTRKLDPEPLFIDAGSHLQQRKYLIQGVSRDLPHNRRIIPSGRYTLKRR